MYKLLRNSIGKFNNTFFAAFLMTALLGGVSQSEARSKSITVKSGAKTVVAALTIYFKATCTTQPFPRVKIRKRPKHGTATIKKIRVKIDRGPCKGKPHNYTVVYYRSKPGYRGKDYVGATFTYETFDADARRTSHSQNAKITVK